MITYKNNISMESQTGREGSGEEDHSSSKTAKENDSNSGDAATTMEAPNTSSSSSDKNTEGDAAGSTLAAAADDDSTPKENENRNENEEAEKEKKQREKVEEIKRMHFIKYKYWPTRNIDENPGDNDVRYGRGAGTTRHQGNKQYRRMVEDRNLKYVNSKNCKDKSLIASEIVQEWRAQSPPGRFLKQNDTTKKWGDVGDVMAKKKTMQLLREKAPQIRKKQEKEEEEYAAGSLASLSGANNNNNNNNNNTVESSFRKYKSIQIEDYNIIGGSGCGTNSRGGNNNNNNNGGSDGGSGGGFSPASSYAATLQSLKQQSSRNSGSSSGVENSNTNNRSSSYDASSSSDRDDSDSDSDSLSNLIRRHNNISSKIMSALSTNRQTSRSAVDQQKLLDELELCSNWNTIIETRWKVEKSHMMKRSSMNHQHLVSR